MNQVRWGIHPCLLFLGYSSSTKFTLSTQTLIILRFIMVPLDLILASLWLNIFRMVARSENIIRLLNANFVPDCWSVHLALNHFNQKPTRPELFMCVISKQELESASSCKLNTRPTANSDDLPNDWAISCFITKERIINFLGLL